MTKPSILVVDDSIDGREMLVEYLQFRGFDVTEASDGTDAITAARAARPQVILMDLAMPALDGWRATKALKADALTRNIVIVALSAHAFEEQKQMAREAGCDAYVAKPYDLKMLADALESLPNKGPAAFAALGSHGAESTSSGLST